VKAVKAAKKRFLDECIQSWLASANRSRRLEFTDAIKRRWEREMAEEYGPWPYEGHVRISASRSGTRKDLVRYGRNGTGGRGPQKKVSGWKRAPRKTAPASGYPEGPEAYILSSSADESEDESEDESPPAKRTRGADAEATAASTVPE